mgnify:FL=1
MDTEITAELKEEGGLRDLIRGLQDLRKKSGLNPCDKIVLRVQAEKQAIEFMEKFSDELKKSAGLEKLEFNAIIEGSQEVLVGNFTVRVKIEINN